MSIEIDDLLADFSVEMTGKDVAELWEARPYLPPGTRVNVAFLGNESLELRTAAAAAVKHAGLVPTPHVSARRLESEDALTKFLAALQRESSSSHLFVVGGDPTAPEGPYEDALTLISAAPFVSYGVQTVSISGYPEGHPDISESDLWKALEAKAKAITEQGRQGDIITQFGFDAGHVIAWIEQVRARGIHWPIRVGVPGPAGIKRLLNYARRFGVGASAAIARKYGFSLTNLLGTVGPERFLTDLAVRLDPKTHGLVRTHFYTFGGLRTTAEWVSAFTERAPTRAHA